MPKNKRIIRESSVDPERGAAIMLVGSTAEGLPLKSFTRTEDGKITAIYGN